MDRLINWIIAHKVRTAMIVLVVAGSAGAMSGTRGSEPLAPSPPPFAGPLSTLPTGYPYAQSSEGPEASDPATIATPSGKSPSVQPTPPPEVPVVPSLVGMTDAASVPIAAAAGYTIRVVRWRLSTQTPGTVIAQHPKPGRTVEPGSTISLTLARADTPMGGGSPGP
jgi:hypothetical protein